MRVLVTGGAGYIGTHTLLEILEKSHQAHVIDNFCNSSEVALDRVRALTNHSFTHERADVRDQGELTRIMCDFRPDAVIHFAGLKAVGESEQIPLDYYDVNLAGTLRVLRAMEASGCKRIVFSSSATVYGEPKYLPYDEAHPENPESVYARSKQLSEKLILDWQRLNPGTSAVALRYFNPVGAHPSGTIGEDPNDIPNNLMPFIAQVAVGRRPHLSVFGDDYDTHDGTGVRDYIHVTDLARAHSAALDYAAQNAAGAVFNIGSGRGYSVLDMVAAFERASGRDIPYQITDRRAGDIAEMRADPARAKAQLDWETQLDLDDMCASVWKWQSQNPNGYGG